MGKRPNFVDSSDAVIELHGDEIRSFCGSALTDAWIAWDLKHDEWFNDEPVILRFGNRNFEASFNQLSQFAMTIDSVDITAPPNWMDCFDGMPLAWRNNAHESLKRTIGNTLRDVAIVDYLFRTTVVEASVDPSRCGTQSESWSLHALEFKFDACSLVLYNALDENGLQTEPLAGDDISKRWLSTV